MGTWAEAKEKHLAEVIKCAKELNILTSEIASVAILNKLGGAYTKSIVSKDPSNYWYEIGLGNDALVQVKLSPSRIVIVKFLHLIPESDKMSDIATCVECQYLKKKMEELFIMKAVVDYSTNTAFTLEFKQGDLND